MANKTEGSVEKTEKIKAASFTKKKLLSSKKYKNQSDVINVILANDQEYTLKDVDDLILKFKKMKG